jgi:hypothetical protein
VIEEFDLEPIDGEFDVVAISQYLDSQTTSARDPQEPRRFLLSTSRRQLDEAVKQRRAGSPSIPYSVIVIFPVSSCVAMAVKTMETQPARAFVEWLMGQQPFRVVDEDGNDLTSYVRDNLDFLFK